MRKLRGYRRIWPKNAPRQGDYALQGESVVWIRRAKWSQKRGGPIYAIEYCDGWREGDDIFSLRGGGSFWKDYHTNREDVAPAHGIREITDPVLRLRAALSKCCAEMAASTTRGREMKKYIKTLRYAISLANGDIGYDNRSL